MSTPADVLGVDESATEEGIQAAFRDQVRRFHPDRFDPDRLDVTGVDELNADELFRDVKQARDALIEAGPATTSLQHEWDGGDPVTATPRDDPPEQGIGPTGTGDVDGPGTDDTTGTEDSTSETTDGPDDDSPWNAGGSNDDAGVDETIGVEIEDGPEESVTTGGNRTNATLSRRGVLAMAGTGGIGLAAAYWMGLFDSGSGRGRTDDHVVVDSSETIQEAADRVSPGGTLEIPPGTYSQYLSVDVDMSIVAPEGATLSGRGADVTAIAVSDAVVEIEGLTVGNYGGSGIRGGGRGSELSISNVTVEDTGSIGLDLTGERIDLDDVTVRNSDATGLRLTSTDTGSISVTDVVATNNKDPGVGAAIDGRGIAVDGGERIVIRDSEATGSGTESVHVRSGDSRGQSVEISDVLAADSVSGNGIRIDGTTGDDDVTIRRTELSDNARGGVTLGGENEIDSVRLENLSVAENGDTGVDVSVSRAGSFRLLRSDIVGNIDDTGLSSDGYGLRVEGGERIVVRESEATGSGNANVYVGSGSARGQSVEISDVLAAGSVSGNGIRIDGSDGEDDVTIRGTKSSDADGSNDGGEATDRGTVSSDNARGGVTLGGENEIDSVRLENLSVAENGDTGVDVSVSRAGSFQLLESDVVGNIDDTGLSSDGYGLRVEGGERIVIRESEATGSGSENVYVGSGSARGQIVELSDFFAAESASGSGVRVDGSNGEDEVTVENARSDDNGSYGFDLGGESVRIVDSGANGNGAGALNLRDIDRDEAEIRNSF